MLDLERCIWVRVVPQGSLLAGVALLGLELVLVTSSGRLALAYTRFRRSQQGKKAVHHSVLIFVVFCSSGLCLVEILAFIADPLCTAVLGRIPGRGDQNRVGEGLGV